MATPGEVRRAVGALTDRQEADIRAAYAKLSARIGDDPIRTRNALAEVLPAIGDTYGSAASALAADVYDDSRDAAGVVDKRGKRFRAKAAPLADQGRYDALAGWAVGPLFGGDPNPDAVVSKVVGGMQRTTADAFRETIIDNTKRDPNAIGWRRIGHGNTCEFCRMLINRGAVYLTEESANFAAHDLCKCTVAAAFKGEDIGPLAPEEMEMVGDDSPSAIEAEFIKVVGNDRPQYVKTTANASEKVRSFAEEHYARALRKEREVIQEFEDGIKARRKELRETYGLTGNEYRRALRQDGIIDNYRQMIKNRESSIDYYEKALAEEMALANKHLATVNRWQAGADDVDNFTRGDPMNIREASIGTNLRWSMNGGVEGEFDYTVNCTRCATAYEMRRRGYDVVARGTVSDDAITKMPGRPVENWRDKSGNVRKMAEPKTRADTEAIINSWPVGARGFIEAGWKGGSGHIWNVERTKDGYKFVEAQVGVRSGTSETAHYWDEMVESSIGIVRVDDLIPTDFVGAFVQKVDRELQNR